MISGASSRSGFPEPNPCWELLGSSSSSLRLRSGEGERTGGDVLGGRSPGGGGSFGGGELLEEEPEEDLEGESSRGGTVLWRKRLLVPPSCPRISGQYGHRNRDPTLSVSVTARDTCDVFFIVSNNLVVMALISTGKSSSVLLPAAFLHYHAVHCFLRPSYCGLPGNCHWHDAFSCSPECLMTRQQPQESTVG